MAYTLKDLSKILAKRNGITIKDSKMLLEDLFYIMDTILYAGGEDIQINRFGSFRHKTFKEKRVRHPETGEMTTIPERDVVRFIRSEVGMEGAEPEHIEPPEPDVEEEE